MNMFGTYGGYGGGFGGGFGAGAYGGGLDGRFSAAPSAYDEYYKAYSMAMLPGRERANVSYGGKIIMPPSALARLTHLEIESPWLFSISNAGVSTADYKSTHAGVLEFIAEEGCVHLPAWMMRTLNLAEGDPIHLKGTMLPQGKFVKIQPQTVDFLEISDPKAVLEQAMRNFSCLTKGDIIEFSYNCLTFEIEVLEVKPDAEGIAIIETDLEVDFAAPKGYVEPAPVPRPPPPTMADKLKIDQNKVDSMPASGTSTPRSVESASAAGAASGASSVFKGQGATLSGKKARKSQADKPIEALDKFSMIRRTDVPRIVTNDTQLEDKKVPAALRLPFGQLYFGYDVVPLDAEDGEKAEQTTTISFSGGGQTLSGRAPRRKKEDEGAEKKENKDGGRTLGGKPANKDVIAIDDSD